MKLDITRICGHRDRIKIYDRYATHGNLHYEKLNVQRQDLIIQHERLHRCRKCSKA